MTHLSLTLPQYATRTAVSRPKYNLSHYRCSRMIRANFWLLRRNGQRSKLQIILNIYSYPYRINVQVCNLKKFQCLEVGITLWRCQYYNIFVAIVYHNFSFVNVLVMIAYPMRQVLTTLTLSRLVSFFPPPTTIILYCGFLSDTLRRQFLSDHNSCSPRCLCLFRVTASVTAVPQRV